MMKINIYNKSSLVTHEGGPSSIISPLQTLKRLTMACLLWEDSFYVDGKTVVDQIREVCKHIKGEEIVEIAVEIHEKGLLRHIPLLLLVEALKKKANCVGAISIICSRPDQMTELLALYWKDGKRPLSAQLKKGLAKAFVKFSEYQLAKYNRPGPIKLKDVLFLCHAKPKDDEQALLWKKLINNTMEIPYTWETELSAGKDKKETFENLIKENKIGKLALVRNLRNMYESGVDKALVSEALMRTGHSIFPFQYIAGAAFCPAWEDIIDPAMIKSMNGIAPLEGLTCLLVDVSGSMEDPLSSNSKMMRKDAACGLAVLIREIASEFTILSFSEIVAPVPPRQGMALCEAIWRSQPNCGTRLGQSLTTIMQGIQPNIKIDRIIVITDEQTSDKLPVFPADNCYIINVSNNKNGIGNNGQWKTITGFSERVIDYIRSYEEESKK